MDGRWPLLIFALVLTCAAHTRATETGAVPYEPDFAYREQLPPSAMPATAPARRFANLSPGQCVRELRQREIDVLRIKSMGGVAVPVRLPKTIGEVRFITPGRKSIYGILDCRLVLALQELATVLAAHDVAEIHVDNFYRPNARLPGKRKRSQHAYGLAVDVHAFRLKDGRLLLIERDFRGSIGQPVCGENAEVLGPDNSALILRNVVCALARVGIFHSILTPNYNQAHRNHLHLDIRRGADYYIMK